ncbi:MAG: PIG-L deacetylase family protein [Candidatus Saccharimonadaceae bacterium]
MSDSLIPLNPKIVLGVGAHPDDLDVTAGGTLAQFAAQGAIVHYLILTDGGKGSDDQSITSKQLVEIRHAEQKAALEVIGGKSITFLDYPDGELEITMELKKQIVKTIRTLKPDVVITMDPTVIYSAKTGSINHPDHRAAGQATLDAVFPLARDHLSFPDIYEEFKPHKTATILLANFNGGNYTVDISDTFETKTKMMQTHVSQFGSDELPWLRKLAEQQGEEAGYSLAETFVRIDIN